MDEDTELLDGDEALTPEIAAQLAKNWHRLSALYGSYSPRFHLPVPMTDWRPAALACLARGHYAMQSVFALEHRRMDAAVLLRVSFEHLVTFAWLMIAPEQHYRRMLRKELDHTKNLFDDLGKQSGTDHSGVIRELQKLEPIAATEGVPRFDECARRADEHWSGVMPDNAWNFRRAYANLYRPYSAFVHPLMSGLKPFIHATQTDLLTGSPNEDQVPGKLVAGAAAMLADALFVASETLGWPSREDVAAALTAGITLRKVPL